MRKIIILLSVFLLFLYCKTLTTEELNAKREQIIANAKAKYEAIEKSKYSVDVIKHPDYSFKRTNPSALIVYDGFEPKKNYLIIGKISIIQLPKAKGKFIRKEIEDKVGAIGGNAILITEKRIGKKISSDTIGIFMPRSLLKYFQITTEKEKVSTISYYGYVVRWK